MSIFQVCGQRHMSFFILSNLSAAAWNEALLRKRYSGGSSFCAMLIIADAVFPATAGSALVVASSFARLLLN